LTHPLRQSAASASKLSAKQRQRRDQAKPFIQLMGRLLLVFMYFTMIQAHMSPLRVLLMYVQTVPL
jgi:hypothetical protein